LAAPDGRSSLAPFLSVGYGTLDLLFTGRMGAGR
jgi:hypothetical protein